MPTLDQFALALQGAGAGLLGQGPQFQQQVSQRRAGEREEARLEQVRAAQMRQQRAQAAAQDLLGIRQLIDANDIEGAQALSGHRLELLGTDPNANPSDTMEIDGLLRANKIQEASDWVDLNLGRAQASGFLPAPETQEKAAGTREFESLTKDLSAEQKNQAVLINLGLSPRAVGSAIQTIAGNDLAELVGDAKATIKGREKFAEASATSRAKTIDKGFDRITKIDSGVRNIDRAISLLDKGAGVGAIESLLPSFKAASVALDNIQGMMALDVVGATTFGALSKGELDLAKEIALPTGLDTDQLIQHLSDKKTAQTKLRDYFSEQIDFLDQGGTVAGFLRKKERDAGSQDARPQAAQGSGGQAPQAAAPSSRFIFNPATGQLESR